MVKKEIVMFLFVALVIGCLMPAGCARKSKQVTSIPPEETQIASQAVKQDDGEFPIDQNQSARDLAFSKAGGELKTIYFDYDQSVIKSEAIARLEAAAAWLKANPNAKIQIEGHCDERGTDEYNLALGERRALAARRYLITLGVNSDQIFTMSYGEERPAVEGHGESTWQYNRRDEFNVSL